MSPRVLGRRGFSRAASSLSRLLGRRVRVTRTEIEGLPSRVLRAVADEAQTRAMVALRIRIHDPGAGWILIVFPAVTVYNLLHVLTGAPPGPRPLTEGERSAVQEVGNILASSFLSELGDLVGQRLLPTVPEICLDDIPHAIREVLASLDTLGPETLVMRAGFGDRARNIEGQVIVIPDTKILQSQ